MKSNSSGATGMQVPDLQRFFMKTDLQNPSNLKKNENRSWGFGLHLEVPLILMNGAATKTRSCTHPPQSFHSFTVSLLSSMICTALKELPANESIRFGFKCKAHELSELLAFRPPKGKVSFKLWVETPLRALFHQNSAWMSSSERSSPCTRLFFRLEELRKSMTPKVCQNPKVFEILTSIPGTSANVQDYFLGKLRARCHKSSRCSHVKIVQNCGLLKNVPGFIHEYNNACQQNAVLDIEDGELSENISLRHGNINPKSMRPSKVIHFPSRFQS